jgi:hypothetical protein
VCRRLVTAGRTGFATENPSGSIVRVGEIFSSTRAVLAQKPHRSRPSMISYGLELIFSSIHTCSKANDDDNGDDRDNDDGDGES